MMSLELINRQALALRCYRDSSLNYSAQRVYDHLLPLFLDDAPIAVKANVHADRIVMDRSIFSEALNALVSRGYLIEHERGPHRVRRFALATNSLLSDPSQTTG
jgi:DNA-binding MarR family transcriptional regulator